VDANETCRSAEAPAVSVLQMVLAMKHPRLKVSAISGACLLRSRKLVAVGKLGFC
jgi:hypothetical protein